jgi:CelD/BcsL family acetyltransferase involved in cellulose biosynthesis
MLQTDVIQNEDEFDALESEWNPLLSKSCSSSVTLTWHWLRTWWEVYREGRQLRVITVRENGRLIGAAPLLLRAKFWRYYRALPFRRMELLASGEAPGRQICSDYIDWIAETGRETEVASAVLDCLCGELRNEWDELCLPDISEESPNLAALEKEAIRRRLKFEVLKREPCSLIRLPDSWEEFLESVSSGLRYKIRRGQRELAQLGGRYHVIERYDEIEAAMEILIGLHQQRWTEKGKPGAFASPQRRSFHQTFIPIALREGWLRLGVLYANREPIGAMYNFQYNGKVYFYQSGITVPDNNHLRPGLLMHSFEIEAAIESGCVEYDFLKRGRSEYKDTWANHERNLLYVRIAKQGPKERILESMRFVYEKLGNIKHRFAN